MRSQSRVANWEAYCSSSVVASSSESWDRMKCSLCSTSTIQNVTSRSRPQGTSSASFIQSDHIIFEKRELDDRTSLIRSRRKTEIRRPLATLIQLFLFFTAIIGTNGRTYSDVSTKKITYPSYLRVNRCYSCMSPMYQDLFRDGELSQFFFEPKNFTSQCEEQPMDTTNVGMVPCRAICLTLTQEFTVMGRKSGRKLTMRGCATSLSRFGFHNQTIALFDQYDLCRDVRASDLFRYGMDTQPISVCSCLGDRCNGAAFGGVGVAQSSAFVTTIIIMFMTCFVTGYFLN
ncbi:hypothetical protein M3Y98_00728800 [Aphelenchoides besseyi]|nr:hypothetical protein M3Y98_00728800 [Aphelenchoides besseyi]KAI6211345.1 hypothetical protein M3Y96_00424400 [Aphelenchoides besseyi]